MIDVGRQIDAVRRQVGTRAGRSGEARVVTVRQMYEVTREEVWDACTNAQRIPRWFLPVSGELRLGGTYQLEGNAGGTVERCDPPRGFAATWEFGGEVSWIEVRLTAVAKAVTRFELAHIAQVDEERWAKYGPGAVGVGWDLGLMGLAAHLSSGRSVDPKESVAWLASEEGRRFVTLSSEGWYRASLAAGEPETAARGAAGRTAAAYGGGAGDEGPRAGDPPAES
ncbi:SRPBCC family protein [Streptomyces sp. NPDC005195]|uniref:SRPBCC family protein n=1 Tax=Streptomyces sp. NPDC005195 TaxID=3154561 RepID=UPI0033B3732C